MKTLLTFCLLIATSITALAGVQPAELAAAKKEILPLFEAMQAAANAHDSEKHVSFYAKEPDLRFVINDQEVVGWDRLLEWQRKAWQDGKTDVVYTLVGEPAFEMPAPGLVMMTYFLKSHRTAPDGTSRDSRFGITALWQRRPEGWRIIHAHESVVR